jgi:hypothetical protein
MVAIDPVREQKRDRTAQRELLTIVTSRIRIIQRVPILAVVLARALLWVSLLHRRLLASAIHRGELL